MVLPSANGKRVYHGDTEGTELHGEKKEREVRSEKNCTAKGAKKTQGERVPLCTPCVSIAILAVKLFLTGLTRLPGAYW